MYLLEDDWVADPGVWDVELLQWSLHHAVLRLSHAGQADEALEPLRHRRRRRRRGWRESRRRLRGTTACLVQDPFFSTQACSPDQGMYMYARQQLIVHCLHCHFPRSELINNSDKFTLKKR